MVSAPERLESISTAAYRNAMAAARGMAAALLPLTLGACNLALGIDGQEAIPANCGIDSLDGATAGFADIRTSHCYSVVERTMAPNFDFASNECNAAGGYLACVGDEAEFDLINLNVVAEAWLGMRFDDGEPICANGERFDPNLPIWENGAPNNQGCSRIRAASVRSADCAEPVEKFVCEFVLGEGN